MRYTKLVFLLTDFQEIVHKGDILIWVKLIMVSLKVVLKSNLSEIINQMLAVSAVAKSCEERFPRRLILI